MACGVLGWSPQAFWQSTYWDLTYAIVGYKKANKDPKSFTRKEVRDLKEDFDKRQEICPDAQIPGNQLPKEVRERLKQARKERAANTRRN